MLHYLPDTGICVRSNCVLKKKKNEFQQNEIKMSSACCMSVCTANKYVV